MNEQQNTQTVQQMYAAFGRGDVQFILSVIADDVDWQTLGPTKIKHAGPHRGRDGVGKFFKTVAETVDIQQFEPREFIAQGDKVVALGYYKGRVKATGRGYETEWAMAFTFRNGKIAKFREYADTANLEAAY